MQIEQWSAGKSTIRYLIPRTNENGTVHNVWKNAGMNRIAIMKANFIQHPYRTSNDRSPEDTHVNKALQQYLAVCNTHDVMQSTVLL
jgi:hypothetical protein